MTNNRNNKNHITIKDIARISGVSISTVSRVLNETGYPVSEEVKTIVKKTAKELNYSPNLIGRQLINKSSTDIGVIVPSITHLFYPILLSGVEEVAKRRGFNLLLFNSGRDANAEKNYLKKMYQKRVAGIIVSSISQNKSLLEELLSKGIEVVTFDQVVTDLDCSKVFINAHKAGQIGTQFLINHNHRDIAFISPPLERYSRVAVLNGYKETLQSNGISVNNNIIKIAKEEKETEGKIFEFEYGKVAVKELLGSGDPPTAIFCSNDMLAYGCIQGLTDQHLKIPQDISVLGSNNFLVSSITNPPLSTIDVPAFQMGKMATEILIDKIQGIEKNNLTIELAPSLVVRESVAQRAN